MSSPKLKVVIPAEKRAGEARVATVPDVVGKLIRAGVSVEVESGAGDRSQATDEDFRKAGATVSASVDLATADAVLSVNALEPAVLAKLKKGALTISFLSPTASLDSIAAAKNAGVTAFSL